MDRLEAIQNRHSVRQYTSRPIEGKVLERIKEEMTEEEMQVFKRGRNANSATMAKHATMSDYRRATGFEALMGYLYLTGRTERIGGPRL